MKTNNYHDLTGERKDQLLITVDKSGKSTGNATRIECHSGKGKTHLAFLAFVMKSDGKIILARRSNKKSLWPGFWDASVVSHVLPGETIEEAAKRRGREELGININFTDKGAFYYYAKHGKAAENEYCHVLVSQTDKKIYPNLVEIEMVKLVKFEELVKSAKNIPKIYTPWLKIALEKIDLSIYIPGLSS